MMRDELAGARWSCASTAPDLATTPAQLGGADLQWRPASVPGTAAAAMRDAGAWSWGRDDEALLDGRDWWFVTTFPRPQGESGWDLELGGLATLADVWLNDALVCHSENMFVSHSVPVSELRDSNQLAIRCAALAPVLARRHPRPRFKSRLVRDQALRYYRTTLLGRMPGWSRWAAPVGPWRPVSLRERPTTAHPRDVRLVAECLADGGGRVTVTLRIVGAATVPRLCNLRVGEEIAPLTVSVNGHEMTASGELTLPRVERWWPHTHGPQPLYAACLDLDGVSHELRRIGFRTIEVDRRDAGFTPRINGVEVFCRGVTWGPVDGVSLTASDEQIVDAVTKARAANVNLVRVGGFGIYEDARFWDACDAQGIMVWQDCMIASVDPPEDDAYRDSLSSELREQFGALQARPSLVIAAGSSETYQQGAMLGLAPERYRSELLESFVAEVLEEIVPDVPYVPSTPSGGEPPFRCDVGVAHYFGVGAYMRPLEDARLADVRFASECLSFGTPPERETVSQIYGTAAVAGHDPRWKLAVAHDAGTSWDFEDVRDHYVRRLFDLDPLAIRYEDPEFALDLGRAVVVHVMETVLGGWRRTGSRCAGAIVLAWGDLWPGAGWGVVDALGRPKAPYHALARAFAPRTVRLCDLGLNGLAADIFNDGPDGLQATLRISVHDLRGGEMASGEREIELGPHTAMSLGAGDLLGGFWDLTAAYRFSAREQDAVLATLTGPDGRLLGRSLHLPGGPARPRTAPPRLTAVARPHGEGWTLAVSASELATFVALDVSGMTASDSWLHIAPGETVEIALTGEGPPEGSVRALNCSTAVRIRHEAV
jgi:beta-mannosidase